MTLGFPNFPNLAFPLIIAKNSLHFIFVVPFLIAFLRSWCGPFLRAQTFLLVSMTWFNCMFFRFFLIISVMFSGLDPCRG